MKTELKTGILTNRERAKRASGNFLAFLDLKRLKNMKN